MKLLTFLFVCFVALVLATFDAKPQGPSVNEWVLPDLPDSLHVELCHKDFLRFWRLRVDGHYGDWHLYNKEDERFMKDTAAGIRSGRTPTTAIEWFALAGKLPSKKEKK